MAKVALEILHLSFSNVSPAEYGVTPSAPQAKYFYMGLLQLEFIDKSHLKETCKLQAEQEGANFDPR